jgi:hypothetical protein
MMKKAPQKPSATKAPRKSRWLGYEWFSVIVISAAVLVLHVVFFTHAGGLWRDEAGFVGLATLPSWHDVWEMLPHDHCPMLVPALLRLWCKLGWGGHDFGLRMLGLILGLCLPISFFAAARIMRRGTPFLALGLVAVNVLAIRFGDSLRAYGFGSALNVLGMALIWRAAKKPGLGSMLWAALAAVLSVQCLYQNAVFIFAGCCGAFVICLMEGRRRDGWRISGIGLLAAVSLIPYVAPMRRSQEWWLLQKTGFSLNTGWRNLATLMGCPFPPMAWLWAGLVLLALCIAAWSVKNAGFFRARDLILFNAVGLSIGLIGFVAFLKSAQLPTQPWYFLPLLTFMAFCLDAMLADLRPWMAPLAATFALGMAVAACMVSLPQAKSRQTNLDLVAARLMTEAAPEDYIVVQPWYYGVTFYRYYHGGTPWTTLPPIADHDIHRFDEIKARMQETHPIQPVIDRMLNTLQTGHRVWVVGALKVIPNPPPEINPAPNNPWGWVPRPYWEAWEMQAGSALAYHALQGGTLSKVTEDYVNPDENVPMLVFTGWRPSPKVP